MFKYLFIILVVINGCKNEKKGTIIFTEFPKTENIKFTNFLKYENGVANRLFLRDTSLIVYDWRGINGYFFYEYGLYRKLNLGKYIPFGRKKGHALGSLSAGIFDNTLWMYDLSLNKIIFKDLTQPKAVYRESSLLQQFYNIQFLDDANILGNGNYKVPNKLQEVNLYTGKITESFGPITDRPENIPFYAWKRANESSLIVNDNKDKAVLANMMSDQLEIFDLKTQKSITIKGPENFGPEFKSFKSADGEDLVGRNSKSRHGFTEAVATNKFIYLSFSGNAVGTPYISYTKTIYVYNWEGQPIKKINLDRYIAGYTISKDDKTLYAYDVVSKFIVKTKI